MPFNKNDKANREDRADFKKKPIRRRKKVCIFCADKNFTWIDYKDVKKLSKFVSERGKILPRRVSGTCAKHQRSLTVAIKRARHMALLSYVNE